MCVFERTGKPWLQWDNFCCVVCRRVSAVVRQDQSEVSVAQRQHTTTWVCVWERGRGGCSCKCNCWWKWSEVDNLTHNSTSGSFRAKMLSAEMICRCVSVCAANGACDQLTVSSLAGSWYLTNSCCQSRLFCQSVSPVCSLLLLLVDWILTPASKLQQIVCWMFVSVVGGEAVLVFLLTLLSGWFYLYFHLGEKLGK